MIDLISEKRKVSEFRAKPREVIDSSVWQVYEARKSVLQQQHMTGEEYQEAIRRLADELGV